MSSEGGYTFDPEFKMPMVSEPPTEPATPPPSPNWLGWIGFDPAAPDYISFFDGKTYSVHVLNEDHIVRGYD